MTENKEHKKSPIKDLPVRMPGQSLRESIAALIDEDTMPWVTIAFCMIILAFLEWITVFFHISRSPWLFTIIAGVITMIAGAKIWRTKGKVKTMRLGQTGEEAVGQFLEEKLRPAGYQILHDVVNDRGNVDHVLIGPSGIYTIETKTHSKPAKGPCLVTYDGEKVKVNGYQPDRDPVAQAKAEAGWLSNLIESCTGKKIKVQPVVLYPGWFITATAGWHEVWVFNEISFVNTVAKFNTQIDDADIHLITYHLKRYVITREKQAKAAK